MANKKKGERRKNPAAGKKQKNIQLQDLPPENPALTEEQAEEVMGGARFRPQLEVLENRDLMSVAPILATATVTKVAYTPPPDPIQVKYQALGGQSGVLGSAVSGEMSTPYGNGKYELFAGGAIFYSQATGAHWMNSSSEIEWAKTAGEIGGNGENVQQILGLPTADQKVVPANPSLNEVSAMVVTTPPTSVYGATSYNQVTAMQGGHIWDQALAGGHAGTHVTYGGVDAEYAAMAKETANGENAQVMMGMPTGDETNVPGVAGARMTTFQDGNIYWSAKTGAHAVYGDIFTKYISAGGPVGYGLPIAEGADAPNVPGARVALFQLPGSTYVNAIYRTKAYGAHLIYGEILREYNATATEVDGKGHIVQAVLGAPTSDEMAVPGVAGARMNTFQNGAIYWSPATGAHVVYGTVYLKYLCAGGPAAYGLPIAEEAQAPYVSVSGGERFVQFKVAGSSFVNSIYYSQGDQGYLLHGAIYQEYLGAANKQNYQGYEMIQALGVPTSDEMDVPGVSGARMNTFAYGAIYWSPTTGAHIVTGGFFQTYSNNSWLGLPTSDETQPSSGTFVIHFQRGSIQWTAAGGFKVIHG